MDKPWLNKPLIGVAAVVIASLGAWFYWRGHRAQVPVTAPSVVAVPPAAPAPEPAIQHPLPEAASASSAALPALSDSDKTFNMALAEAVGAESTMPYWVPDSIIRHLVVTVDNLPRQKVAVDKRPLPSTPGLFQVDGDELHAVIDSRNYSRYEPLVGMLKGADSRRVADVYLRFYPLFQKAYQDLGYPNAYFNDRLIEVIDLLLATPELRGAVELERPNVMYEFADPMLEALPAGQKLLIRMGPSNAATVKTKLREIRALVVGAGPKH